jgi:plasmid stability protein
LLAITIRALPEETHRAIRLRAAQHGCSTEAEICAILEEAVRPESRLRIGSALAAFGRQIGGIDLAVARDQTPTDPATFE